MNEPLYELIASLMVKRYSPRPKPLLIPSKKWDECPTVCLEINQDWMTHIIGVMAVLDQFDAWVGSPNEIEDARQQVKKIVLQMMGDTMSCCCPEITNKRYTVDGKMEVSYDGGLTWEDAGNVDPRNTTPLLPPLVGTDGADKKCEASQNVSSHVKSAADSLISTLEGGVAIGGLVAAIFALLFFLEVITLGAISPLLIGLAAALLQFGDSAFSAAMTAEVYYDFQCIIHCHMGDDGRLIAGSLPQILSEIHQKFTGIASTYLYEWCKINGEIGINNMAATDDGIAGDSCDDCGCADCAASWSIVGGDTANYGNIIGRGGNYIIVQASYSYENRYDIHITTPTSADCCQVLMVETITGSGIDQFWADCNSLDFRGGGLSHWEGECAHYLIGYSATPFTIKFTFADCP